jgi:hypothetical protein
VNLRRALRDLGDPFQPVELATRELLVLVISANVRIDPDYQWEVVVAQVRARLLEALGFDCRELGQGVATSEVLSAMQAVPGVVYVDLDSFDSIPTTFPDANAPMGRRPLTPDETAAQIARVLGESPGVGVAVSLARLESGQSVITPAELAVLLADVPETLVLNQIK